MIKKLLRLLISDERLAQARFERIFLSDNRVGWPVLFVHQMGKVGSTTLVRSIKELDTLPTWRIYQTHFLSPEGRALVEGLEAKAHGGKSNLPEATKIAHAKNQAISKHLYQGDFANRRAVKVISLVRDPVATNLSGFFHNTHWWPEDLIARSRAYTPGWETELLDYFLSSYPHDVPADWFDMEMKAVFGIDVFAQDFDQQAGYQLYDSQAYPLLLLRLENMNESMAAVVSNFLGLETLVFGRSNSASDKWYAELYRKFMETVTLPETYLDRVYGAQPVNHFYSTSEIAKFRERWEKPESIGFLSR